MAIRLRRIIKSYEQLIFYNYKSFKSIESTCYICLINLRILKKFLKVLAINLVLIAIVWVAVVYGTKAYLNSYTNHGEKFAVPNFMSEQIHVDDLDIFVEGKGITYEVIDSIYDENVPPGTVIYQTPLPTDSTGMYVKSGRKIILRISKRSHLVEMPAVAGKTSKRIAEAMLISRKLVPKITFRQSPEGKDQVMEQLYKGKPIEPGTKIPARSKIELIVSKGKGMDVTQLPSFVGMTINDARLRSKDLAISLFVQCEDCQDASQEEQSVVVKQSPEGGEGRQISSGSTITLWSKKQ